MKIEITKEQAAKVLSVVDAGLTHGVGVAKPGQMCVEAAVAYAFGEKHTDQPMCVAEAIRQTKILLNDHWVWSGDDYGDDNTPKTKKIRAAGLRRIAIAQLGTKDMVSDQDWHKAVAAYLRRSSKYKKQMSDYRKATAKWRKSNAKAIEQDVAQLDKELKAARKKGLLYIKNGMGDVRIDIAFDTKAGGCCGAPYRAEIYGSENPFDYLEVQTVAEANKVVEDLVQILVKLKAPGAKFLYLAPLPKAKKAKAKPVKKVAKKRKAKKVKALRL